ncbi:MULTISPECIES: AfsR/SARP family transcriptional regulator [unclassified Amycolatopsis]|uniref:AfsR/SARP family transcriptional regulator n=1 Tax=unclassified Amycolatopsis TaxID=2618356 RepID=UPI0028764977|nr:MULTISPECIES: AfsR/SARP family transcriptional regulator [unclassified Amycolatopsis]MDS0139507.1 AfsR/SARP family transcriptional regulator [Amycolatopsis sp. 505]MDS0147086.1 AfsR/SARP family transcriptional regulator [Amycolatopsis sp. CM201R]
MGGVDLGVLGPFEVRLDGEPRDVGGPRLRTLLAVLTAEAGRVVSVPALSRALWGEEAPAHADRTVRTYLSRLRGTVGAEAIRTRPPGYALHLAPEALDAARFEHLAAEGRRELAAGEPAAARQRLAAALDLWRGHAAYEEFGDVETLAAEGMRLDRLRHNAVQDRIDADLALGEDTGLIAELEALTAAFPGHERLWGQLMTALYRAGRQSDALEAFRRARHGLITASGVEPSPVLAQVHRRVLAHHPALLATRAAAVVTDDALTAGEHALLEDGDLRTSREHFETAYVRAERAGDATALARAALGLGGVWVHEHRTAVAAASLLTRLRHALDQVAPGSALEFRLQARLAAELDYEAGTHDRVLAAAARTRAAGDPVAHAEALSLAHHCLLGPDHTARRQALATELVGVRTGRRTDLVMGVLWDTVDRFLAGDPHAERRLGELDDLLAERKHLAAGFVADALKVMLAIRAGRFREAEAGAQACAEVGQAAGDFDALGWYGAQLVAIRWFQGRLGELVPVLDGLMHSPTLSPIDNSYYAALAVAAASAGDRRTAAGALARLCGEDLGALPRSSTWLTSLSGAAETAYLLDDRATAARVYELLAPFGPLPAMASLGVACFGSVHHPLGTTALTAGDPGRAVTHLRAAVRHNLALAHWPAVVFSRRRHAEALVRRGEPGDRAAADREWAAADEEAKTFGGR